MWGEGHRQGEGGGRRGGRRCLRGSRNIGEEEVVPVARTGAWPRAHVGSAPAPGLPLGSRSSSHRS
jgi:hypothetical protein